jgi:hypothetical protein
MKLVEVCLRTTHFQVQDKFLKWKDVTAMGSSLSPIVSSNFMEHLEKMTLDSAQNKTLLWLRYIDNIFVDWSHATGRLQKFLSNLNSLRPFIQYTMQIESESAISFLDVLVVRKGKPLTTKVCRKSTHIGRYLNFKSNHSLRVKRCIIQSLHNRICNM